MKSWPAGLAPLLLALAGAPSVRGDEADQAESANTTESTEPARPKAVAVVPFEADGEGAMRLIGLPAVSADGQRVAFVSTKSEYSEASRSELRIATAGSPSLHMLLDEQRNGGESPIPPGKRQLWNRRLRRAARLLRSQGFVPLARLPIVPVLPDAVSEDERLAANAIFMSLLEAGGRARVGNFFVRYDDADRLVIEDAQGKRLMSPKIEVWQPWYCCPGHEVPDKIGCSHRLVDMQVWGNGQVLFITGKNNLGADGCELYERYVTIWPARGVAHSEQNVSRADCRE